MHKIVLLAGTLSIAAAAAPAAQSSAPARSAVSAVQAGTYDADPSHTQVIWSVDHMGFSRLYGMVGAITGTLRIDPARPQQAAVQIDIPLSGLTVTSPAFGKHLQTPDLFDTAKFPTARFVSRNVAVGGQQATITGDLTLRGVTKPLTLRAHFHGAGTNPMSKAATIGFSAEGELKRSDFGLGYAVPAVSDTVKLEITAAFEKAA